MDDTAAVARINADVLAGLDEQEGVEREARRLIAEDKARAGKTKRVLTLASARERITRAILPDRLYREAYSKANGDQEEAVRLIIEQLSHLKQRQRDAAVVALKRCLDALKIRSKL